MHRRGKNVILPDRAPCLCYYPSSCLFPSISTSHWLLQSGYKPSSSRNPQYRYLELMSKTERLDRTVFSAHGSKVSGNLQCFVRASGIVHEGTVFTPSVVFRACFGIKSGRTYFETIGTCICVVRSQFTFSFSSRKSEQPVADRATNRARVAFDI